MRRRVASVLIALSLLAACGDDDDSPSAEDREIDKQLTEQIYDETDCVELAETLESRRDDLANQERDPDYGMSDYQVELMEERVAAAEERMAELDC